MADLFASRQPVRLNDGTADANNAAVLNAAPVAGDYGLTVRQIGIAAAAALADGTANPTTVLAATLQEIFNGTTWDRRRSIAAAMDSTGTGIAGAGLLAQLDDAATATVTENQFAPVRLSSRRALLVEGVASGTALGVDTELPTAAALAESTANPTVPAVGSFPHGFDGTTWDRLRTTEASDGNGALTATGILAAGVGPGFARRANPANLGTVIGNASTIDVNGASSLAVQVGTTTTGTYILEVTDDGTTFKSAVAYNYATGVWVTGSNLTPTTGDLFVVAVGGMRQFRLRTVATLGATMAHVITWQLGDVVSFTRSVIVDDLGKIATVRDLAANDALNVAIVDGSGNQITTFGGGTQYTEDAVSAADPVGTQLISRRRDVLASEVTTDGDVIAVNSTSKGELYVKHVDQIDTELPAAAALADNTANPTVPGVGAFLMGFDGTTWDRVGLSASGGRLQVDVISGGGSPAPSEIPSSYNALIVYGSTSATASAATASVTTNTPANTKLVYVREVMVSASGATKWQLKFGATVLATGFIPSSRLEATVRLDPPSTVTGDGTTALTVDVTNREASAMDLYARMGAIVQA